MAIKCEVIDGKKLYEVYVNGHDANGKRIQRRKSGIESMRKAEQIEFEYKHELAKARDKGKSATFEELYEGYLKEISKTHKYSTVIQYARVRKWVEPHLKSKDVREITKSDITSVIFVACESIKSERSRKSVLSMTKAIFKFGVEEGFLAKNPCDGIKVKVPEAEQQVLTNSEVEIFLRNAKLLNHKFYPIWVFALFTGMRSAELYALKWTDIDMEGRKISVTKQWARLEGLAPTKTGRNRIVPISNSLFEFIKGYQIGRATEGEWVLPRPREWQMGSQAEVTGNFCDSLGITRVSFHDLRATFITNLLSRGETLARVMSIVGHSQIKTTNGYLRKAGVDVAGGTEKLGYDVISSEDNVIKLVKE